MPRPAASIAHSVAVYSQEILNIFRQQKVKGAPVRKKGWSKPEVGFLKINCDAAFDGAGGNGGWGYIIRDAGGDVVSAGRGRLRYVLDPLQAEAIACLQGLQAAVELGIGHAIVETDAQQVVHACTSSAFDLTSAGSLISELRDAAAANFLVFKFVHVPRTCNKVADALAALGSVCDEERETVVSALTECISVLVTNDLAPVE